MLTKEDLSKYLPRELGMEGFLTMTPNGRFDPMNMIAVRFMNGNLEALIMRANGWEMLNKKLNPYIVAAAFPMTIPSIGFEVGDQ